MLTSVFHVHFVDFLTGAGNFGSVMRGIYKRGGQRIPVAIKTLKQDDVPNAEVISPPPEVFTWSVLHRRTCDALYPALLRACLHRTFWLFAFVCKLRIYWYVHINAAIPKKIWASLDVRIKLRSYLTSAFAFSRIKSTAISDSIRV